MQELKQIQEFVDAQNSTNSNTDKLNVLKQYADNLAIRKVLEYTYNTFKQYYVTSETCKKRSDLVAPENMYSNLFSLLDDLNDRNITGHSAIQAVNAFVGAHPESEELIFNIIDRNLKTRATASMINTAIPDLIPTFDVALAKAYDEKTQKKVKWSDGWFVSRKLDGCRCVCIIDGQGEPRFYSRVGNEFLTLDNLKPSIRQLGLINTVLDGEICMIDEKGNEDFTSIMKEIKRKDHTIEQPHYYIFDHLTIKEFESKVSTTKFGQRIANIESIVPNDLKGVSVLDQFMCADDMFVSLLEHSKNEGWEGLMLRKNTTYKGKRSDEVLKVKSFIDAEYYVLDVENDVNRVIVDGAEVSELMLKNIIIEHKGNRVQVGSGFSHEQRRHYFNNPDQIIGKQVTIQYFEETTNQNGTNSLRFPVIKAIYETERDF
jgi:DNA ligase-1